MNHIDSRILDVLRRQAMNRARAELQCLITADEQERWNAQIDVDRKEHERRMRLRQQLIDKFLLDLERSYYGQFDD